MQQWILVRLMVLAVVDYRFGLLILFKTQIVILHRIQNETVQAVLGCTLTVTMHCLLRLPSMRSDTKFAQVSSSTHPLHKSLMVMKACIKHGSLWVAEAETSLSAVCALDETAKGEEWVEIIPMNSPEWLSPHLAESAGNGGRQDRV